MAARLFLLFALPSLLLTAGTKKNVATAQGENEDIALTVTLHIDPAAVKELIGNDLDGHYIVADVKVEPKYGKTVAVDRDDFLLRTNKDGEKAKPYVASQIAGRGALVISQGSGSGSGGGVQMGSPTTYPADYPPYGYPGGYPPTPGVAVGGGDTDAGSVQATARSSARDKVNPLEKILADRALPDRKTDQPVSGLLYFPMEKQKMKDLEVVYGAKENRITLRFK
jgi:hypothetical protein